MPWAILCRSSPDVLSLKCILWNRYLSPEEHLTRRTPGALMPPHGRLTPYGLRDVLVYPDDGVEPVYDD